MTKPRDKWPQLEHAEEQFVRRLAAHYAPKPLTPARRVVLDEALWARLQRQPRQPRLTPALATVAMAMLITCLSWSGLFMPPAHDGGPSVSISALSNTEPWEYELLYSRELTGTAERDDGAILPDDYLGIARVFLDK
jgi:hypothetical protein